MTSQSDSGVLQNQYDYMIGKNHKTGELENNRIVDSWAVSAGAKRWTYQMKEGIPYYRHGEASDYTFDPIDIRWTWLLQAGIESDRSHNSDIWKPWFANDDGSDIVIEGNTVTFNLDSIRPDANAYLSEDWNFGLISKAYWDNVGEEYYMYDPIGMGPFSFLWGEDKEYLLLERNVDHHRKTSEFHELMFHWISDTALMMAMTLTRDVHIAQLPGYLFDAVQSCGLKIAASTIPSYNLWGAIPWYLPLDLDGLPTLNYDAAAPTRKEKVRLALNLAIDREQINDAFFEGNAIPGAASHFSEWKPSPAGTSTRTGPIGGWPYTFDPQLSMDLLAQEGYSDGLDLTLYAPTDLANLSQIPNVGRAIAAMWEEIGINVHLEEIEYSVISEKLRTRGLEGAIFLTGSPHNLLSNNIGMLWRKAATPYYEYPFITSWKELYSVMAHPIAREHLAQKLEDFWYENHLSIPLLWIFGKAVYDPAIVEAYEVNHAHFGPTRYHEYTVPVYQ